MSREAPPREVAAGVVLCDTGYTRPAAAAAYLVRGGASAAVVETGTALSVPRILAALEGQGIAREAVSHVVVTHVHLDHAGGAGALLRHLPAARLVVHPRGARHLADPSRLLAGAAAVYGGAERIRAAYGEVVGAPAERIVEAGEGFRLDLGGRVLHFLDAPGHARHHVVVHDPASGGVFTGDSFGLAMPDFASPRGPFLFPTTTPVQFDPPALKATIGRILALRPERLYLTHYGPLSGDLAVHAATLRAAIDDHVALARAAPSGPERGPALRRGVAELLLRRLAEHRWPGTPAEALAAWESDIELNAQGLEVWLSGGERGS